MSARGKKRRRGATVEAPTLEEIARLVDLPTARRQRMDDSGGGAQQMEDVSSEDVATSKQPKKKDLEKVFNDPVHGHIELHPLMVKFIDTPQFQRLRYIKQLGGGYYVFPGASHNRFEHSIGVGYLAGELAETLQRKQAELGITDVDVLCVKLAGLCHDLGHGPFSHLFDGKFIPSVLPGDKWKHEDASVMMLDHLIKDNGLMEEMEIYKLDDNDVTFIKELIVGSSQNADRTPSQKDWPYEGRPESKSFLYEIVANKKTGVDVDKWDYFARDCHHLGIPNSFDLRRYMTFVRVIKVEGRQQICTRDKEVTNLYEMFHTRSMLHRRAYQHKTSNVVEQMITEALVAANDHLLIPGSEGEVKMSEAIRDPVAFTRLTDQVLQQIQLSTDPNLQKAKDILAKVEKRRLYKHVGQTQAQTVLTKADEKKISQEMISCLSPDELGTLPQLSEEDIIVVIATFDYGKKAENPIDFVRFYTKETPHKANKVHKDQVSQMLPPMFMEQQIRVFCRRDDRPSLEAAWKYFKKWCDEQDYITPTGRGAPNDPNESDADATLTETLTNSPYIDPKKSDPEQPHTRAVRSAAVKNLFH